MPMVAPAGVHQTAVAVIFAISDGQVLLGSVAYVCVCRICALRPT